MQITAQTDPKDLAAHWAGIYEGTSIEDHLPLAIETVADKQDTPEKRAERKRRNMLQNKPFGVRLS